MYLSNRQGITEVPKRKRFRSLFCKHNKTICGISCSSMGLQRISGEDYYQACLDCGKILDERHTNY